METPEPPLDLPGTTTAIGPADMPEGLATPIQGGSLARRTSQKRQSLTGLKFLNELLDDHDHDHDSDPTNVT
jgi:hypothetical protein